MAKKKPRSSSARSLRRKLARIIKRDSDAVSRSLSELVGGTPARAIEVDSAAVIEPRATREPCVRCGATVEVGEHVARVIEGRRVREVVIKCRACGSSRSLFFALPESVLH